MKSYFCIVLALLSVSVSVFGSDNPRPPMGREDRGERGRQERSPRWPEEADRDRDRNHDREDHHHGARHVTFNVFCRYYDNRHRDEKPVCYAGALFKKSVGVLGGEVFDETERRDGPQFEVECEGSTIYNSGARRYTDRDGTRIQAETGPYPAIVLPPGALRDKRQRVDSELELRDRTLSGDCFLYTET